MLSLVETLPVTLHGRNEEGFPPHIQQDIVLTRCPSQLTSKYESVRRQDGAAMNISWSQKETLALQKQREQLVFRSSCPRVRKCCRA